MRLFWCANCVTLIFPSFLISQGSRVNVVLGAQWGDEGKGKMVDMLATTADVVCRCQVSVGLWFVIPEDSDGRLPRDSSVRIVSL